MRLPLLRNRDAVQRVNVLRKPIHKRGEAGCSYFVMASAIRSDRGIPPARGAQVSQKRLDPSTSQGKPWGHPATANHISYRATDSRLADRALGLIRSAEPFREARRRS
jgi:hypothetical protein